ncbi:MAG: O-antigen ligase family protein [Ktedonobacterales bacterium]
MSIGNRTLSGLEAPGSAGGATGRMTRAQLVVACVCCLVVAVALIALPPTLAGWLVLGGATTALVVVAPMVGLLLLPFAVAFGSLVALDAGGIHAGPTDLLVAALVIAWGVRRVDYRKWLNRDDEGNLLTQGMRTLADTWRRDRLRVLVFAALLAYLGVIVLSLAVAFRKPPVLKEVIKWTEVAVLAAVTYWAACTPRRVRWVVWALIAAGLAEALLGYGQWMLSAGAAGPGGDTIRVLGTFGQPNPYSGYLNYALLPAVALALFSRDVRERWVAGAASVLLLGAQVLANSRGGMIGLAVGLAVIVVVGLRRERLAALVAAVGVPLLLVAWLAHLIPARLTDALLRNFRINDVSVNGRINDANYSTMERLAHWLAGLRMFQAHPLLGVGAGNYDAAYLQYGDLMRWPESLGQAHNYYINVAAETGAIGLLAFIALVVVVLLLGWRATHPRVGNAPSPATGWALALGLFAVLVALTAHNLTDDLFVHGMELQAALSIGCLLRLKDQSKDGE